MNGNYISACIKKIILVGLFFRLLLGSWFSVHVFPTRKRVGGGGGMVERFLLTALFDGSVVTTVCTEINSRNQHAGAIALLHIYRAVCRIFTDSGWRVFTAIPRSGLVIRHCWVCRTVTALGKVKERFMQHALPFVRPHGALQRTVFAHRISEVRDFQVWKP